MVISYVYSTCWRMKLVYYEHQHIPPTLNFWSSSSKAKPEVMQEIRGNTSIDPCLDLPNGLMRPYLEVPTHLIELFGDFFTLSWVVE
jgi:hypothetical protein